MTVQLRGTTSSTARWAAAGLAVVLSLVAACESEPVPESHAATDEAAAEAEKKPAVDPKIARAMEAAAASASAAPSAAQANQPPPNGILGPQAADREVARGAPSELVFGGAGSSPRLRLGGGALEAGSGPSVALELGYRSGGTVLPTVSFELQSSVRSAAGDAEPWTRRFQVRSAQPAATQPGRLPT